MDGMSRADGLGAAALAPHAGSRSRVVLHDWSPELQKSKVYEQILLDIILGELAPGARLDEQELVRRYQAGLAGVRDALGRLALEGLVIRRARSGTIVSPLDIIEVRQAFEACGLIEPHCAALAAINADEHDIALINRAFDGGEDAVKRNDHRALVAMDQNFHASVAIASGNATLARILIPLQHKATRFWAYAMNDDGPDGQIAELQRHRAVAVRIAKRDAEGARAAMMAALGVSTDSINRVASSPASSPQTTPLWASRPKARKG
jgi:DNA-binding GntR family transcriptional regulator